MEDVDDHLQVIEHNPLTGGKTVHCDGTHSFIFPQACLDLTCDRLQLRLGRARTDDKKVGESGNSAQIEHDDLLGFFVRGEFSAGTS